MLGEVQSEGAIAQCLPRVLKKLNLRRGRDAVLSVANVAFRKADTLQQRRNGDVLLTKGAIACLAANPVAVGKTCQDAPSSTWMF